MLSDIAAPSLESLLAEALPGIPKLDPAALRMPLPANEQDALHELADIAQRNTPVHAMCGGGFADAVMPAAIRRMMLERPGWYSAYTPYQAEISQGRLEMLLRFQDAMATLTGHDVCNASMLCDASAAAEAVAMAARLGKTAGQLVVLGHPHARTLEVLQARASAMDITIAHRSLTDDPSPAVAVLVQYPDAFGYVVDLEQARAWADACGALLIVGVDPLALACLPAPASAGADICYGVAQRFGMPMMAGGPHAGFMTCKAKYLRQLPGRLVGISEDSQHRRGLRMALQAREQHIRRERATSNICTAQALPANLAAAWLMWHGEPGLRAIAADVERKANGLATATEMAGVSPVYTDLWGTVAWQLSSEQADRAIAEAREQGIILGRHQDVVTAMIAETTTDDHLAAVARAVCGAPVQAIPADASRRTLVRAGPLLHSLFAKPKTEAMFTREIAALERLDLTLDRSMIPLGSCTMKLNAASELEPVSWPEFGMVHPHAPQDCQRGTAKVVADLESWLSELTGFTGCSLEPNAGSQGELAGLLMARAYQVKHNQSQRNVCLVASSAHGTNAASAAMAGLKTVAVASTAEGSIDIAALEQVLEDHRDRVCVMMLTWPSTHGVYESGVTTICDKVHEAGGVMYLDGANFNALAGVVQPAVLGFDVCHLNLHKTFCIPHGGGGPGVGPVLAGERLAPFLPSGSPDTVGAIASAPFGSAGILPVTWMYLRMMGAAGIKRATEVAVLSANWLAVRAEKHVPVLYRGTSGRVAHEFILDYREITKATGVTVEDIAKRLIDYGFHAPTVSFPVAGTLMIEPTESEDLAEMNRLLEALGGIIQECEAIQAGRMAIDDSPLRRAPHTLQDVMADEWTAPYSRSEASCPGSWQTAVNKYWPPVSRIDTAGGDRQPRLRLGSTEA